ncbi:MAG: hypothetical protein AB4911_22205 [Oscillochloridaceae bacterium umkhey_bin13]
MSERQRTVRKGRIYYLKIADVEYRAFIWETGTSFCGRIEDHPKLGTCQGKTVTAVRNQLSTALTAALKAPDPAS